MYTKMLKCATAIGLVSGAAIGTWKYQTRLIPISEDEVIWVWLKAEISHSEHQFASAYANAIESQSGRLVLACPNFDDTNENEVRRKVFDRVRGDYYLWRPIHASTRWYRSKILVPGPFLGVLTPYLPFIYGPYPPGLENPSKYPPSDLEDIILWGNSKMGPFTILEGNHRWYHHQKHTLMPSVYIGLSDEPYELHAETLRRCQE